MNDNMISRLLATYENGKMLTSRFGTGTGFVDGRRRHYVRSGIPSE